MSEPYVPLPILKTKFKKVRPLVDSNDVAVRICALIFGYSSTNEYRAGGRRLAARLEDWQYYIENSRNSKSLELA